MPRITTKNTAIFALFLSLAAPVMSEDAAKSTHADHGAAPYAGFEARAIKSLSEDDIAQIQDGGGWGLALPAELNGLPGPKHVLELSSALALSDDQIDAITTIYNEVRAEAIAAGQEFIAAEAAISDAFAQGAPDDETLMKLLDDAAKARAHLRFIHLSRHGETAALLSAAQIELYNRERGYVSGDDQASDPCQNIPEGHDAEMWKQHNGCE